jgi:nucleoside-triphosphatase THEP1
LTEPLLIVVTGPVGGGKSTAALELADRLRVGIPLAMTGFASPRGRRA